MSALGKIRKETSTTMRWDEDVLAILDSAAAIRGVSRSELVRSAALREAEEILQTHARTRLDLEQSQAFLAALGSPAKPNPLLKKLLQKEVRVQRK